MIHPKVCVQVIDQCVDMIQRYQSERRYSMKKMKLIKSKKMLTVLLTATAAMAVTPMAGYAGDSTDKAIVNQSSEATVEVLSGTADLLWKRVFYGVNQMESGKEFRSGGILYSKN